MAHAVAEIWAEHAASRETPIQSATIALDTSSTPGRAGAVHEPPVLVTINGHPEEETLIHELPEQLAARHPTWQTRWRKDRLEVVITADGAPSPIGGPPIAHRYSSNWLGPMRGSVLISNTTTFGCVLGDHAPPI